MTVQITTTLPDRADALNGGLADIERSVAGRPWLAWAMPGLSLAIFVAAVWQMHALDVRHLIGALPRAPGFWAALVASYFVLPASEWLIYRRLWGLPAAGIAPLLRKHVSNEILLGYSGELYFYAWARRRLRFAGAPFGAVKDVAVLSAQAGNVATLALLVAAWPWLGALRLGHYERELLASCVAAMALSLPIFLLRRRLFALPAAELRMILGVHLLRIAGVLGLTALAWHAALPGMALGLWLLLSALRQLLSRLPFMPNKDLIFAALALFLLGPGSGAADLIALSASLILCLHLFLGVALASADLLAPEPRG